MGTNDFSTLTAGRMKVVVSEDRRELGIKAARDAGEVMKKMMAEQDEIRIVFAAAPSQNEFLDELSKDKSIDWSRVTAFHMDEYIGLPEDSGELFARYLTAHIFSKVNCKKIYFIDSQTKNYEEECKRYEKLLREKPIDIVYMGIGENGHIAFNDPPYADFNDPYFVKLIELDEKDKAQQVNDAGFKTIDEVPSTAYTLTVPALLSGKHLHVVVPGIRKAEAVRDTFSAEISTRCPATILRTHPDAVLYLDAESASLIK